jgi:hypothetical protein
MPESLSIFRTRPRNLTSGLAFRQDRFYNSVRVAAVFVMTDNPNPSGKTRHEGAARLEEARLRQQAIGVKLRHMFDEVVNEPVPDEFLDILRRADERSSGGTGA